MNPFAAGIDVPVSQTPAGVAINTGPSSGYSLGQFGSDFLSGLGKGILGGLDRTPGTPGGYSSRPSYTDQTRDLLGILIRQAVDAFKPGTSTIS